MRMIVNNLLDNTKMEFALEERNYLIGRDTRNDIVLDNFFVSQRQAIFRIERGQAGIKPVGEAQMKMNGKVLNNDTTYLVGLNDEIVVGQYVLSVLDDAIDEVEGEQAAEVLKRLNDLERGLHEKLIERMDLRKVDPGTMPANKYRERVESMLDELIEEQMGNTDSEMGDYIARLALMEEVCQLHRTRAAQGAGDGAEDRNKVIKLGTLTRKLHDQAVKELSSARSRPIDEESLEQWVRARFDKVRFEIQPGTKAELLRSHFRQNLLDMVFGLGPLEPLLNLKNISEIMVVEPRLIYVEKNGRIQKSSRQFVSDRVALSIIERIVAPLGLRLDRSTPLVDARLPDGSRVNVIIPPLAVKGPCITIRKFSAVPLSIKDLVEKKKALSPQVAEFMRASVLGRKNVIISGGTGSGKTTLLNCLSEYVPHGERIVTVEDSAELQLKQEHVVSLEGRPANAQGKGAYTIRDLVRNSLRMRPDRIIVGECRGGEALDMLQAMNTGHDGSMTTGHANSPSDMIRRLETMVLLAADMPVRAIREQIASAIDLIIQVTRFGDGARKITHVTEVVGLDPDSGDIVLEDIFKFGYTQSDAQGSTQHTGYVPTFFPELIQKIGISIDLLFDSTAARS